MRRFKGAWNIYGKKREAAQVAPASLFNGTKRELRPCEFIVLHENGFSTMQDPWTSSHARTLRHGRRIILEKDVYRIDQRQHSNDYFFLIEHTTTRGGVQLGCGMFSRISMFSKANFSLTGLATLLPFLNNFFVRIKFKQIGNMTRISS